MYIQVSVSCWLRSCYWDWLSFQTPQPPREGEQEGGAEWDGTEFCSVRLLGSVVLPCPPMTPQPPREAGLLYLKQIGLRNSTQLCVLWIPAFAGMTATRFFANHFVWSISVDPAMEAETFLAKPIVAVWTARFSASNYVPVLTLHRRRTQQRANDHSPNGAAHASPGQRPG